MNKQTQRKGDQVCGYQEVRGVREELDEGIEKVQMSSYKVQGSTR